MVQYGGRYMRCVPLSWKQNIICLGFGAISLPLGVLIKFIPARWFAWIRLEAIGEKPDEDEKEDKFDDSTESVLRDRKGDKSNRVADQVNRLNESIYSSERSSMRSMSGGKGMIEDNSNSSPLIGN